MKEKNGITIISLVVTVVVLLIIAGVSMAMLSGDDSIINNSKRAKKDSDIAEETEKIELSVEQAMEEDDLGRILKDKLSEKLSDNLNGASSYTLTQKTTTEGTVFTVKIKATGNSYEISPKGLVKHVE